MLTSVNRIRGATLKARDGPIGHVTEAYFDDEQWAIRYLVADTGSWLAERQVLIPPSSVRQPLVADTHIDVRLSRQQVRDSPDIDTHAPISRRHEREILSHYAYPDYWAATGLWALDGMPALEPVERSEEQAKAFAEREARVPPEDLHLRSSADVTGYRIGASDGPIGHVKDFIFDDRTWDVRYLVVDTRNWWPGSRKVLIATQWVEQVSWADRKVSVKLTREQIKDSPAYKDGELITHSHERRLHHAYGRRGYWDL